MAALGNGCKDPTLAFSCFCDLIHCHSLSHSSASNHSDLSLSWSQKAHSDPSHLDSVLSAWTLFPQISPWLVFSFQLSCHKANNFSFNWNVNFAERTFLTTCLKCQPTLSCFYFLIALITIRYIMWFIYLSPSSKV